MSSRQDKNSLPIARISNHSELDRADFVIIGNGIAGLTAAVEARRLAPDKRIVIITDQSHPTINTPALKQFAIGKLVREQLLAYPAGTERKENIRIINAHVEEIHADQKYLDLRNGRVFGYTTLLIATGGRARGLPPDLPGRDFDGVLTLHRLQDYLDLRRRLNEVSDAVVVGGGIHAVETVMGLLHWGIRVHWLIRSKTFMAHSLDQNASNLILERIRRAGALIYTETEVVGIIGRVGSVAGVITNQQKMISCEMVLCCTGSSAAMTLAERCTLPMQYKRGIHVSDQMRTSVRDIYAAGDVAALKNPLTGQYEPRAQWYAAVAQGKIAGAMMAEHRERARQPFGVQWHATHLGDLAMLNVGYPLSEGREITTLTDQSQGGYRRMALYGDRLVGYLALGDIQPDSLAIKRIIDEGHPVGKMTRDLLKGNFDARKYLSQVQTHNAHVLITGQLPDLEQPAYPLPATRQLGPALTPQEPIVTTPLPSPRPAVPLIQEDLSPFSGNLPDLSSIYAPGDLNPFANSPMVEEFNAFSGNLPSYVTGAGERQSFDRARTVAYTAQAQQQKRYGRSPDGVRQRRSS